MNKQYAYSMLVVKSVDDEARELTGIATTPTPDKMDDIVEPKGAQFKLPIPLLLHHDHKQPIGEVYAAKVTDAGIEIKARIIKVDEPGKLKDRLDEAWQSVKHGLIKGLSIGFMPIETADLENTRWGVRFIKWLWYELSAVTIPANTEATILSVKSIDQPYRAASGKGVVVVKTSPGVSGPSIKSPKGTEVKTIAEQIASFEAKRAASVAKMSSIMEKAGEEGRTLDEQESQEYDGLEAEVKAVDAHIARLKAHEVNVVKNAKVVDGQQSAEQRGLRGNGQSVDLGDRRIIRTAPNLEKGIPFTRYVKALAMARGNKFEAQAIAESNKHWMETTPQVALILKAAVAAGDTLTSGWASEIAYKENLTNEFIEFLRPATVLGKIQNLTRVPFNVRMGGQNSASSAYWVGQGKPVPVSKLGTTEVTLGIAKAAGLVVLTEELVRNSSPAAEILVRNDLRDSIAQFLDVQFLDPNYAEVTNVSPASITNGVTPLTPSGTDAAALRKDMQTLIDNFTQNNLDISNAVWIMSPTRAMAISMMLNSLGQEIFPQMTMQGGTFLGLPCITSLSANIAGSPASGDMIILANAPEILLADDGEVAIDASREASIQMLDNPTNDASGSTVATSMVSMFQTNSVAIKAVRFINWKKRRTFAVQFVRDGAYI